MLKFPESHFHITVPRCCEVSYELWRLSVSNQSALGVVKLIREKSRVYVLYIMYNLDVVRKGACISVQDLYGFSVFSNSETTLHGYSVQCNSMRCELPLHLSLHVLICTYVIALYIYLRSVLCPLIAALRVLIYTTCTEPCRRHEYVWWIAVLGWQRICLVQNGNVIIKINQFCTQTAYS